MIGVVVPVHDEETTLGACLCAIRTAAGHPLLRGEAVRVVVVLDDCTDGSALIAARMGAEIVAIAARNVGEARAAGANALLGNRARWLAFTDADSVGAPGWLADQLSLGVEVVCGAIAVDWPSGSDSLRARYERHYLDADGHRHIHGANLGVAADVYRRAGGFAPLRSSEDVALVRELCRIGASIAWSPSRACRRARA